MPVSEFGKIVRVMPEQARKDLKHVLLVSKLDVRVAAQFLGVSYDTMKAYVRNLGLREWLEERRALVSKAAATGNGYLVPKHRTRKLKTKVKTDDKP